MYQGLERSSKVGRHGYGKVSAAGGGRPGDNKQGQQALEKGCPPGRD